MRGRVISNAKSIELAEQGKAAYKDGATPARAKTIEELFDESKKAIQSLGDRIGQDVSGGNEAILTALDAVLESMRLYHEALIVSIDGIPRQESVDLSPLEAMNGRMDAIISTLARLAEPKEWDFKIERDWRGALESVKAVEKGATESVR
jgi:hypothetical protein